jgi:Flp pilus assembly protein TadD
MHLDEALCAAQGWLELDLPEEALQELNRLGAKDRMKEAALEVRLVAQIRAGLWNAGADTGRLLCLREPREPRFFLHAAYCLHETGDTEAARNWLMTGPACLIHEPMFHYNIACYHAVLGERDRAESHLKRALAMDESLRDSAESDRDLAGLENLDA